MSRFHAPVASIFLNIHSTFCAVQAYVALSRARSLEGLQVLDWDMDCVKVGLTFRVVAAAVVIAHGNPCDFDQNPSAPTNLSMGHSKSTPINLGFTTAHHTTQRSECGVRGLGSQQRLMLSGDTLMAQERSLRWGDFKVCMTHPALVHGL